MKKLIVFSVLFVSLSAWFSCTKDTAIPPPAPPVCDSTHVRYTESVMPILNNNCTNASGCHNGSLGLGAGANDLTTYIAVQTEVATDSPSANSILCRVEGTACGRMMPLGSYGSFGLSTYSIDTLKLWKAGGYCD
jgi:hypothetical protein